MVNFRDVVTDSPYFSKVNIILIVLLSTNERQPYLQHNRVTFA